jgi:hypothetical protein
MDSHADQASHEDAARQPAENRVSPHQAENCATHGPQEQAARSVMHPDHSDPDWRYYLTAWHS